MRRAFGQVGLFNGKIEKGDDLVSGVVLVPSASTQSRQPIINHVNLHRIDLDGKGRDKRANESFDVAEMVLSHAPPLEMVQITCIHLACGTGR